METNYAYTTKAGTAGGTLLILILKINISELASTAIFAAVGASVSFTVSIIMKELIKIIIAKLKKISTKPRVTKKVCK